MSTGHGTGMSSVVQEFKSDGQLRQFFIDGVTATGRNLGAGAYGTIVEVSIPPTVTLVFEGIVSMPIRIILLLQSTEP